MLGSPVDSDVAPSMSCDLELVPERCDRESAQKPLEGTCESYVIFTKTESSIPVSALYMRDASVYVKDPFSFSQAHSRAALNDNVFQILDESLRTALPSYFRLRSCLCCTFLPITTRSILELLSLIAVCWNSQRECVVLHLPRAEAAPNRVRHGWYSTNCRNAGEVPAVKT